MAASTLSSFCALKQRAKTLSPISVSGIPSSSALLAVLATSIAAQRAADVTNKMLQKQKNAEEVKEEFLFLLASLEEEKREKQREEERRRQKEAIVSLLPPDYQTAQAITDTEVAKTVEEKKIQEMAKERQELEGCMLMPLL